MADGGQERHSSVNLLSLHGSRDVSVKDLGGQVRRREKSYQILYWDWENR